MELNPLCFENWNIPELDVRLESGNIDEVEVVPKDGIKTENDGDFGDETPCWLVRSVQHETSEEFDDSKVESKSSIQSRDSLGKRQLCHLILHQRRSFVCLFQLELLSRRSLF